MFRPIPLLASLALLAACNAADDAVGPDPGLISDPSLGVTAKGGRAATMGAVYVSSQGLWYDTFVAQDPLPFQGRFQQIEGGITEFGPGDPGYLGGRWWEDVNQNGIQDAGDHFFLCPLLPPGRPSP
jgi:hypothetical protein